MNRILFDARWIRTGMTGVGRFAYNLLRSPAIPRNKCGVVLTRDCPFTDEFKGFHIFRTKADIVDHPSTDLFEQCVLPWLCYRHGYGSLVSFEGRLPVFHPGIRTYPIIYDLTYLHEKGSHSHKYAFFLGMHARLSRMFATSILTISETVRQDLIRTLGMPPEKIFVAYPAGSRLADHEAIPVPGLDKPFFLAVGITNARKNFATILKAFAGIHGVRLAVTGNADLIVKSGKDLSMQGVANLGFVRDGELRWLYENAAGLVYASLNEGFGIPLIDAAEFDCPVLCSDIPVFREVMGTAARYFDPKNSQAIRDSMEAVLAGLGPDGGAIKGRFSWDDSARNLMNRLGIS